MYKFANIKDETVEIVIEVS